MRTNHYGGGDVTAFDVLHRWARETFLEAKRCTVAGCRAAARERLRRAIHWRERAYDAVHDDTLIGFDPQRFEALVCEVRHAV